MHGAIQLFLHPLRDSQFLDDQSRCATTAIANAGHAILSWFQGIDQMVDDATARHSTYRVGIVSFNNLACLERSTNSYLPDRVS